ncbi:hypothetical protein BGX23_005673, partial [Mortierella sp. AD031]
METIPTALGPDDCTEWKTFIEGSKKARGLRDAEETKTNPGKQQQQQQKKPVSAQVSGGAATNDATIPSTPAQQNHQGQFNGHGGDRGRGRGRFQPYRGESRHPDPDPDPVIMPISEEKGCQDCIINFGAASVNALQEDIGKISPEPKQTGLPMQKGLQNELLFADD